MARRRTKEAAVAVGTSFNPAEFDPAYRPESETQAEPSHQAATIVQQVADSTRLPEDMERQAAHENGHAARHEHRAEGQSHAEAVGRRPGYSAAGMTDVVAGVKLKEHQHPYLSVIRFDEKPSDQVREKLREAGFNWNSENKEWVRPIRFDSRAQDRLNAERVFEDVAKTVREERGISHGYGGQSPS